eukprot:GHVR01132648.1.p1 GENE.GHVR01132648.1~~GHVR01132648.1.p1  ORF type:complete len:244 (+),score=175.74 GHVR01132648.1:401-1132(+)
MSSEPVCLDIQGYRSLRVLPHRTVELKDFVASLSSRAKIILEHCDTHTHTHTHTDTHTGDTYRKDTQETHTRDTHTHKHTKCNNNFIDCSCVNCLFYTPPIQQHSNLHESFASNEVYGSEISIPLCLPVDDYSEWESLLMHTHTHTHTHTEKEREKIHTDENNTQTNERSNNNTDIYTHTHTHTLYPSRLIESSTPGEAALLEIGCVVLTPNIDGVQYKDTHTHTHTHTHTNTYTYTHTNTKR